MIVKEYKTTCNILFIHTPATECFISFQVEKTSPVQWPENLPWPAKVDLEIMKGLLFRISVKALSKHSYFYQRVKIDDD